MSPFPNILLTPVDASPLNAPVAGGATTFGAILATIGRTVLAKKRCKRAKKSPIFTLSRYLLLLMFISTPVLSALLILFICVFVNNNGKFPLS